MGGGVDTDIDESRKEAAESVAFVVETGTHVTITALDTIFSFLY